MKNLKILGLFMLLSSGIMNFAYSQFDQVDFLKGGVDDAGILFENYLSPYANILGANMNAGWYNSAKPHKLGGFDVTLTTNVSWAPASDLVMDLSALDLTGEISGESPTVAGNKTASRPEIVYNASVGGQSYELARYTLPDGTGLKFLPAPMIQAGVGLPFGTEITGRFLPTLSLGSTGKIGLWGVGLKHSIIQHIPGLKKLPVLDITAQGAFSKLKTYADINYDPSMVVEDAAHDYVSNPEIWLDQRIALNVTAWTANLVVSETLPVISFYQAIGYSSSKVDLGLTGNFPMPAIETNQSSNNFGDPVIMNNASGIVKDPIEMEMNNNKDLRLNAGMRIKLGVLTIHFDYTKAHYSVLTAGMGISFR